MKLSILSRLIFAWIKTWLPRFPEFWDLAGISASDLYLSRSWNNLIQVRRFVFQMETARISDFYVNFRFYSSYLKIHLISAKFYYLYKSTTPIWSLKVILCPFSSWKKLWIENHLRKHQLYKRQVLVFISMLNS